MCRPFFGVVPDACQAEAILDPSHTETKGEPVSLRVQRSWWADYRLRHGARRTLCGTLWQPRGRSPKKDRHLRRAEMKGRASGHPRYDKNSCP